MRPTRWSATAAVVALACVAWAAPATQRTITINRSDIALAYIRFEQAYMSHPPLDDQRADVNRAFDRASMLYFTTKHAEAIAALNDLTDSLSAATTRPSTHKLAQSLQVRIAPAVALRTRPAILRIRVAPLYDVRAARPAEFRLVIRSDSADQTPVLEAPLTIDPRGPAALLTCAQPQVPMGRYVVELVAPDGMRFPAGRWSVVEVPLDVLRVNNDRRLRLLRADTPQRRQSWTTALARNALLSDRADEHNSARFLPDPIVLSREVQSEVESLLLGGDPYAGRVGDYWRAILAGAMHIPARVYAPPAVKDGQPLPLVIALHGAGGDESMFCEGYGRGQIKRLADEKGFVVVAPSTYWVMVNSSALESIIQAMSLAYPIDTARVYVVGHSLGSVTAAALAARQPDKIAAMVLFAGGQFGAALTLPRTRVYAGQIDPLVPVDAIARTVESARRVRLPVEMQIVQDRGHTLLVNDLLPEAIEWLMTKH